MLSLGLIFCKSCHWPIWGCSEGGTIKAHSPGAWCSPEYSWVSQGEIKTKQTLCRSMLLEDSLLCQGDVKENRSLPPVLSPSFLGCFLYPLSMTGKQFHLQEIKPYKEGHILHTRSLNTFSSLTKHVSTSRTQAAKGRWGGGGEKSSHLSIPN